MILGIAFCAERLSQYHALVDVATPYRVLSTRPPDDAGSAAEFAMSTSVSLSAISRLGCQFF